MTHKRKQLVTSISSKLKASALLKGTVKKVKRLATGEKINKNNKNTFLTRVFYAVCVCVCVHTHAYVCALTTQ